MNSRTDEQGTDEPGTFKVEGGPVSVNKNNERERRSLIGND